MNICYKMLLACLALLNLFQEMVTELLTCPMMETAFRAITLSICHKEFRQEAIKYMRDLPQVMLDVEVPFRNYSEIFTLPCEA